jgi:hypothetical protein
MTSLITLYNFGYARTSQSVFQIGSGLLGIYDEFWLVVDDSIKMQTSNLFTASISKKIKSVDFKSSIFYKNMFNLLDAQVGVLAGQYYDYSSIINDINKNGSGESYGYEQWVNYSDKVINLNLSYTYSRSKRKFKEIFDGTEYNSQFDRPHSFNLVSNIEIGKSWSMNSSFVFQSGMRYSKPIGFLPLGGKLQGIYTSRNDESFPSYHRLDLGFNKKWKSKKNKNKSIQFSIINAYNKKNISFLRYKYTGSLEANIQKVTAFPIMPSVSYSVGI